MASLKSYATGVVCCLLCVLAVSSARSLTDPSLPTTTFPSLAHTWALTGHQANDSGDLTVLCAGRDITDEYEDGDVECWGIFKLFRVHDYANKYYLFCDGHWFSGSTSNVSFASCHGVFRQMLVRSTTANPQQSPSSDGVFQVSTCEGKVMSVYRGDSESSVESSGSISRGFDSMAGMLGHLRGTSKPVVEVSCDGLGAQARAHVAKDDLPNPAVVNMDITRGDLPLSFAFNMDSFEAKASNLLDEFGVDLHPVDIPSGNAASVADVELADASCKIYCNGEKPWFKMAPCYGMYEVNCTMEKDDKTFDFSGACEGTFTGIFGFTCKGFSKEHMSFESEDEDVDSRDYCVGSRTIKSIHRHGVKGMLQFCKGQSFGAVQKDEDDDT